MKGTVKKSKSIEGIPGWKRAFDLFCVAASSPFWLPFMVLLSLWIKAVSRGPVVFRQERVGYRGIPFCCLKFRSMKLGAETASHEIYFQRLIATGRPMTKLDEDDPRLIFGGKIIRVFGLDELPQLVNVLRGEMSLVGPRPCTQAEFEHYEPHHKQRVNMAPGLTGLWQVNGKNKTSFSEMIEMDLSYGRSMCVALDLTIMMKTVPALLGQAWESRAAKAAEKMETDCPRSESERAG